MSVIKENSYNKDTLNGIAEPDERFGAMMEVFEHRDQMLHDVNRVAALLLTPDNDAGIDTPILTSMGIVCNSVGAGRIHLWRNEMRDGVLYHVIEYSLCGARCGHTKAMEKGFGLTHESERPEWNAMFLRGDHINGPLSGMSQKDQEFLGAYGMKSVAVIPLFINDYFWGLFSIDEPTEEKTYSEEEMSILKSVSLMMASAIRRHSQNTEVAEAHNYTELMFDATPLGCCLWDEDANMTHANLEMAKLFGLEDKQECIDHFAELAPKYQPNGALSTDAAKANVREAFQAGYRQFQFMHQKLDGTPIPTEVTLIRIKSDNSYIVAAYIRDLREYNKMMQEINHQKHLLETVNHVSTILIEPDMKNFSDNIIKAMGLMALALDADRVYIKKFRRENGALYVAQTYEWSKGSDPKLGDTNTGEVCIPLSSECNLLQGKSIHGLVRDLKPEQQAFPVPQSIVSILNVPIFLQDELWGLFGFDDCRKERVFTENEELILRSASRIMANALIRNEMTQEILDAYERLDEAVKQANAANKSKSDFLARMSHEIRTPMNAIIGMTELAIREDKPEIVREHIHMAKQAGVNLLAIINDILDLSKIESGKMQIITAGYSLSSLLNDVISIIRMRAVDSRIRFAVFMDSNLPNALIGDETRLRQILINILGNAVKYTDKGYVILSVSGEIAENKTLNLTMEVKDSGRGIKKEDIGKLFQNYHMLDTEHNASREGVGLGLQISKSLVTAMGGNITVKSVYGKGSTFTVTLPQEISDPEKLATVTNPEEKSAIVYERRETYADSVAFAIRNLGVKCEKALSEEHFRKMVSKNKCAYIFISYAMLAKVSDVVSSLGHSSQIVVLAEFGESVPVGNWSVLSMPVHAISAANVFNGLSDRFSYNSSEALTVRFTSPDSKVLIVDDITTNLRVAKGLMSPYLMSIDLCRSGEAAIEAVKSKQYDIVFMDHRMPRLDGVEATKCIRALGEEDQYFSNLPIVALTANAISGMEDYFLKNGFHDYLTKPIDTVRLNMILDRWIPKEKKKSRTADPCKAVAAGKTTAEPIAIEGLDVDRGLLLSGGSMEGYLGILATFREDWLDRRREIVKSYATGNLRLFTTLVHSLKSAAANIGATELSEAAYAMEMAGQDENISYIESNKNNLLAMLNRVIISLGNALSRQCVEPNKGGAIVDICLFNSELKRLSSALQKFDINTIDRSIETLLASAPTANARNTVKKMSKHILMFEYEKAEALIKASLLHSA